MTKSKKFNIGDFVAVLNESQTGIIVKIDSNFVTIADKDGFEFEFLATEIVPRIDSTNYLNDSSDKDLNTKKNSLSNEEHKKTSKKHRKSNALEVDLHLHQLIDSEKGMRNIDMLNLQLQTAKKELEYAIKNKIQRVVFIHGIGNGVLKKELHLLLKKYKVEIFEASYNKYGQGATEVYVYQN